MLAASYVYALRSSCACKFPSAWGCGSKVLLQVSLSSVFACMPALVRCSCFRVAGHAAPRLGTSGKRSRAQSSASAVGTFSIQRQEGSLASPWLAFPGPISARVFKIPAIPGGLILAATAGYIDTCSYTSEHCAFPVIRFVGLLVRGRASSPCFSYAASWHRKRKMPRRPRAWCVADL